MTQAALDTRIARLQALNEAIQRGDRDGFRTRITEVMHADCEWDPLIAAVEGGVRGRESGVEVPRELGVLFEFEGGLVRRARAYESHREARAAAEALDA